MIMERYTHYGEELAKDYAEKVDKIKKEADKRVRDSMEDLN
jgi:hypothetical protein